MTIKKPKDASVLLSHVEGLALGNRDICDERSLYKRNRSHGVRTSLLTIKRVLNLIYKRMTSNTYLPRFFLVDSEPANSCGLRLEMNLHILANAGNPEIDNTARFDSEPEE